MQVVGNKCILCNKKIEFDSTASWCARCLNVYHKECSKNVNICPKCNDKFLDPEILFAYSSACPVCVFNDLNKHKNCPSCGSKTFWDTEEEYEKEKNRLVRLGKENIIKGYVLITLSFICLIIAGTIMIYMFLFVSGFFVFFISGVNKIRFGKRLKVFA